jgi:nitrosocyanin
MDKKVIIGGLIVLVILIVGFGVLMNQNKSTDSDTQNTTSDVSATQAPAIEPVSSDMATDTDIATNSSEMANAKEFTVIGSPYKFEPNKLTVNKGDTVKITFKNSQGVHDFVIDELDVKTKTLQTGQDETVSFVADKAGTFEYYCSVGNHRAMGMKGTLTVE